MRAPRAAELPFLVPSTHNLPELGCLTGQGGTVNLEVQLAAEPDLIVDFGTVGPTYIDLANRVSEQILVGVLPLIAPAWRVGVMAMGEDED